MNLHIPESLHVPLLLATVAALLGSTAAMTSAFDWPQVSRPVVEAAVAAEPAEQPAGPSAERAPNRCDECGIVESVRRHEGRNEITVRMRDGTIQLIEDGSPAWRPGERAILIPGRGPAD